MRQVNFTLIFVIGLALVLFGLENTQPVSVKFVEGIEFTAPLCVTLVITLGIGAVLAWIFNVWVRFQSDLVTDAVTEEKEQEIETLQVDIERYKAELEEQQRLLPSASSDPS